MTDSAFNNALDALVRGESLSTKDDLTRFAADLYGKEHDMMMPSTVKSTIAADLELDSGAESAAVAPETRRSGRANRQEREYARRPWFMVATVVIAVALALTGILQWGMQTGDNGDDRFGILSPAVPTAEATPSPQTRINEGEGDGQNWLIPITAEECQEDVPQLTPARIDARAYAAVPERADEPFQPVTLGEGDDIIADARAIRACGELVRTSIFTTGRFQYENFDRQFVTSDEYLQLAANRIMRGRSLSTFYQQNMGMRPGSGNLAMPDDIDWLEGYEPGTHPVILPTSLVQLGDGRVALLVTAINIPQPGEIVAAVPEPIVGFNAWVLIEQDGEWLLDELLPVCFGDCAQFWAIQPGANMLATPAEDCEVSDTFEPNYVIEAAGPINLRPGPGVQSGDVLLAMTVDTQLMYLCKSVPATSPEKDDVRVGDLWLKVRTANGDEGWVREIDVKLVTSPGNLPTATPPR